MSDTIADEAEGAGGDPMSTMDPEMARCPQPVYAAMREVPVMNVEGMVVVSGRAEVDEAELICFVKDRIASFKVPRHIRFIEEWPMSASKIQKFKLRQSLMQELGLSD